METRAQSASWYDVLAFLTLASLLGILVGVALGAVALLLAGSAHGADGADRRVPALQAPAQPAAHPAGNEEEDADEARGPEIVLPACEGQARRAASPRRLEI
jgi:hypothetical protein